MVVRMASSLFLYMPIAASLAGLIAAILIMGYAEAVPYARHQDVQSGC